MHRRAYSSHLYISFIGKRMKYNPEDVDKMAEFHNRITKEIDETTLSPSEVCLVLDLTSENVKKLFETSVKGGKV